ncbi:nucleotidyltransferase domain-containing protein [Corynebacterium lubricantis]|uniref:nucleotidyltransferase domain-containing protein n=1 Tax=Corynebacterium lubricantis TaxID=541095 RepID=UPI00037FE289|nr:nucleotidyltransferase [Corynebacterium lubricantis]
MATKHDEHVAWTAQGSVEASKRTYASICEAISRSTELQVVNPEVFLQGSYANNTNTRGDSDVDVVVMMTSTFMPETSRLSGSEKGNFELNRVPGTTSASDFRRMVERALHEYYGSARLQNKNKCITVAKSDGYVAADVVPAMQHRLFTRYSPTGHSNWVEGISITPLQGNRIVNYPKEHISQGQAKNKAANGNYKATVRQVKRLRRKAVSLGLLNPGDAPGYLLECLVSNLPDQLFVNDPSERLTKVMARLSVLSPDTLRSVMWSGDRIHKLFVDDPGQHNEYTTARVINILWDLL